MMQDEDTDNLQIVPDQDKLERYHRQQLSAMLDGELSPDQARFMLRRLQHDADLAGRWERWQVCGDVLRGQHGALLPADFAQKVSAAIAGDAVVAQVPARKGGARLLRWGGGAALAASVAMAALLVGRQAGIEPEPAMPQASPVFAAAGTGTAPAPAPAAPVAIDPAPEAAPAAAAAAIAATAVAATQIPRRASETRTRSGAQPDAGVAGAASRSAAAPRLAVVPATEAPRPRVESAPAAAPAPLPAPAADTSLLAGLAQGADGIGADPFAALPMTVASRPWPRAGIDGGGAYSVGLGGVLPGSTAWPRSFEAGRQPAAELFGLPVAPVQPPPAATAIGARVVPARAAPREAVVAGPR